MSKEFYDNSGIPERHKSFRPSADNKSSEWMNVYDLITSKLEGGPIFALVGTRGAGKTQLGVSAIGFVAEHLNRSALYLKTFDVFLRVREAMGSKTESEKKAVSDMVRPFLLVVDAYEVRSESPFENRTLDHIIDKRYDSLKPTLIISNDTPESFTKSVGSSIISRITETGGIIKMDWVSFRKK